MVKTLDCKGDLVAIRKASELVWRGVELQDMWLKNSLTNIQENSLQWLLEEITLNRDQEIPNNWSINAIAANSMYRICQTIMVDYQQFHWEE
ncbi:hypothetical protein CTI12_AA473130 [Artemisia annua]|uniref:Uncharacterized protein n=1 Tax=Artemisia annua TaxID=35608 RepID=A0A2U1LNX0_ARTAN|nr:hypothetical protein CTI12_AA473130 [Artemisia annua]